MSQRWYDERPEPQRSVAGVLRALPTPSTPGGRDRLPYRLHLDDGDLLPVYGPGVEDGLDRLVDRHVELVGKVVDLTAEGFGRELWVRSVG